MIPRQAGRNDFQERGDPVIGLIAADRQSFALKTTTIVDRAGHRIRLASATISSEWLFSRLEGAITNARVDPGAKILLSNPFPRD